MLKALVRRRGLKTKSTLLLFVAFVVVFAFNTGGMVVASASFIDLMRWAFVSNQDQPLEARIDIAADNVVPWDIATMWLSGSAANMNVGTDYATTVLRLILPGT